MTTKPGRLRGVVLLGGGTVLAAVFGLGFQALVSYHFGAGAETDAWFMSLSIYGFLATFLMFGHMKSIALPAYQRLRATDEEAARGLARGLLAWVLGGTLVLSALLVLAAPLLVDALAPGYTGRIRELTVTLVRIRTPALIFLGATTTALVVLESARRFGVAVSAQKVTPAAVTLLLLGLLGERYGIIGLGWIGLAGGIAGGVLALGALLPGLGPRGSSSSARATVRQELRSIGGQWIRFSGSNAATFAGEWAYRVAASLLPVGLFSGVLYGRMVHDLLHGAINDATQTVSLPTFADAAASGEGPEARVRVGDRLRESLGMLAAVTFPTAAFVAVASTWIVALLFGRGQFLEDGMVGPSSVALRIFVLGFFLQGLNQLLFAASFASARSYVVNRVQIAGHLFRAAILVPAVMAFSFVGLVGAQVAMNVLVLALLLLSAPREWLLGPGGTLRAALGPSGRVVVGVTLLLAAGGWWAVLHGPDPLTVGTAGRILVVGLGGVAWFGVYAILGMVLGVEPIRRVVSRVVERLRRGVATVLVPAALLLGADAAGGQEVGGSLLPADHWGRQALELLEARGTVPVGSARAGPLSGAALERLLLGAGAGDGSLASAALERLREEAGARGEAGLAGWVALGYRTEGGSLGGDDSGVRAAGGMRLGGPEDRWFGSVELLAGEGVDDPARRLGAGVRVGAVSLHLGRDAYQLGGGAGGGLVLSSRTTLDGLLLTTEDPPVLPWLGATRITAGLFPLHGYEAVEDPWLGLLRIAASPRPWLELGLSRAAMVGGHFDGGSVPYDPVEYPPDEGSLSVGDVLEILVGRVTGFDNQVAAFDVRASLAGVGVPLLLYGELGLEDKDRSWGDPGVMAGALWAPFSAPLAFRYEYAAFGSPARWCGFCGEDPVYWYRHTRFQGGWTLDGELLGHPLGGYGLQHLVGVTAFDASARLQADVVAGRLRRDRWNLLEGERPGWATLFRGNLRYRWSAGTEARVEWSLEEGADSWSKRTLSVAVRRYW